MVTLTAMSERTYAQRLEALAKANVTRTARAALKRQLAAGELGAADVLACPPPEAVTWAVGDLVVAQHRWGAARMRKLLARAGIRETKAIGSLTGRQSGILERLLRDKDGES